MPTDEPESRGRLAKAFAHPAALIVLTAALTGLLAPWITNRWEERDKRVEEARAASERRLADSRQDEQRELAVKTALLSRIGTSSATFLSAIEVGMIRAGGKESRDEYRALQTASLEIASQLAAYFPRSRPSVRWRDYTFSLRNTYLLLTSPPGRARNPWLYALNRYLDVDQTQHDGLCFPATRPEYAEDLRKLVIALQKKEQTVVRTVADSDTVLTGTPTVDVNVPRKTFKATQRTPCNRYFRR
jgi:hypothetical protein